MLFLQRRLILAIGFHAVGILAGSRCLRVYLPRTAILKRKGLFSRWLQLCAWKACMWRG